MIQNKLFLTLIIIFFSISKEEFTSYDFLKTDDTQIKNNHGNGNCVYLRGTNLGNLFVQENWMSSTNEKDQKTINEKLTKRFGKKLKDNLISFYENNYFTLSDFDKLKEMGMSVIRVPFTYMNLYDKTIDNKWILKKNAFEKLDWIVRESSKRGIYVILDLHGAFGSQNGQDHSGELIDNIKDVTFYKNTELKKLTLDLWKEVAIHYKNNPAIAGYDILNEPSEKAGITTDYHFEFYNEIYQVIRKIDYDHIIIMESCWTVLNLPNPKKYNWKNVVYEYHHYIWNSQDSAIGQIIATKALIESIKLANYNVPTYIGEFTCFTSNDAWKSVLELFNLNGYHYTSWSFKSNNMGTWGIFNQKGTLKVNINSHSLKDIKSIWSYNNIGTGKKSSNNMVYDRLKEAFPGTIYFLKYYLIDKDYIKLKSGITNKYVCADNYGESNLIANRDSTGNWEHFLFYNNNDGTISIQSRANNKFLCAVFDHNNKKNPIIARSNHIQDWEKFYVENINNGKIAFRTFINNKYIQVNPYDKQLYALGEKIGTWEEFFKE
jgi:aryl-phospho-beta-D-glucosidase BglC (GH1 family)